MSQHRLQYKKLKKLRVYYALEPRGWYDALVLKVTKRNIYVKFVRDRTLLKLSKLCLNAPVGGDGHSFYPVFKRKKFSKNLLNQVLIRQAACAACGEALVENKFEFDHVLALGNGGENTAANLQALCCNCHSYKTKVLDKRMKAALEGKISSKGARS